MLPLPSVPRLDTLLAARIRAWLLVLAIASALIAFMEVGAGASAMVLGFALSFLFLGAHVWWRFTMARPFGAMEPVQALPLTAAPWVSQPWRGLATLAGLRRFVAATLRLEETHLVLNSRFGEKRIALSRISRIDYDLSGTQLHLRDGTRIELAVIEVSELYGYMVMFRSVVRAHLAASNELLSFNEALADRIMAQRDRLPSAYRSRVTADVEPPPSTVGGRRGADSALARGRTSV